MYRTARELRGEAILVNGLEVIPVARETGIRLGPWFQIHSVRPAAVEIHESDGTMRRKRIPDAHGWSRLGGLVVALALMLVRRRHE
jgi:hypothetical protein